MDGVKFMVELIDRLTGPAKAMRDALKGMHSELQAVEALAGKSIQLAAPKLAAVKAATPKLPEIVPTEALAPIKLVNGELETLKQQLRDDKLAVTNLSASLRQLKQAEVANLPAIAQVNRELQARKNSLAEVQTKLVASGNAAKFGSEGTNRLTTTLRELAEAAGAKGITGLAGHLGGLRDRVTGTASAFEALTGVGGKAALAVGAVAVAAVAAAAGVFLVGKAIVDLTRAGASLALEAAEAKGDTIDMLDAMLGTQRVAVDVYSQISALTNTLAVSQTGVQASAQALAAAGVENKDQLVAAVKSIAQVDSVIKGAGGKIQNIIERATATGKFAIDPRRLAGTGIQVQKLVQEIARRTGKGAKEIEAQLKAGKIAASVGIDALAKVIDDRFGALAAKQALDLPAQLTRLRDNFAKLFEDVDTGPFLEALSRIVSIFDAATPSGAAMKEVLTGAFNAVFRAVAAVEPYARTFLKGLVIIALQVAVAFRPLIKNIRDAFGGDQQKGPLDLARTMSLVGLVLGRVVSAFVAALPDIRSFLTVMEITTRPARDLASALLKGAGAVLALITGVALGLVWLAKLGTAAVQAGSDIVDGLIGGLKSGAVRLIEAVTSMGKDALAAFKGVFGIASPSKVMMQMGGHLSTGLALGIQRTAPVANDNMRDMLAVTPPRVREGAGSGRSVTFSGNTWAFHIHGGGNINERELRSMMPEMMMDWLEQVARTCGASPEAA